MCGIKNSRGGACQSLKARDTPPNSLRCNIISHGLDAMRKVTPVNLDTIHEKSMTISMTSACLRASLMPTW